MADIKKFVIDEELCRKCSIANDNWGRIGVTPFAVACYFWHCVHTLGKNPDDVYNALMNKWDSFVWRHSPISISVWNKLFNGTDMTTAEWRKILFPLRHISTLMTSVTSVSSKKECYPMFFDDSHWVPEEFMIVTKESYQKTITDKTAVKVTAYKYGSATGNRNLVQGLREEVTKVVFEF